MSHPEECQKFSAIPFAITTVANFERLCRIVFLCISRINEDRPEKAALNKFVDNSIEKLSL